MRRKNDKCAAILAHWHLLQLEKCWSRSTAQPGQTFRRMTGPRRCGKTAAAMITHRGMLDNTQPAVTPSGHSRYAPVSRALPPLSENLYLPHSITATACVLVQPAYTTSSACRMLNIAVSSEVKKTRTRRRSARGALINSHEAPRALAQLSLTSAGGKQTFQGLFKYNHCT